MRKFAWMFMAAMTVAGFSACNNAEDEPLPGMPGGDDPVDPSTPSVVVTDTIYNFNDAEGNYISIADLCPGWTHEIVSPADDDRTWQTKVYNEEKYIQATAHDSKDGNAGKQYDLWMFTPAFDVKNATEKVFSFYSEGSYWQASSKLEVYVLNEPQSTATSKTLLNPTIATEADGNYKWIASGDIDLSSYGDIVYIGFRYVAEGGASKSTTYCIDNVALGRKQVGLNGGEIPGTPNLPDPSTVVLTDTIYQFNNIVEQYTAINDLCAGWVHEIISPTDDNRTWQSKTYQEEKYIQATAHDSKDSNAGKQYDLWMITPALDVKNAPEKVFSFYSEGSYWKESTKLEVYVLTEQTSNDASKTLLNPTIATQADGEFTWIASGDIDLSSYGDIVYIGFRYIAEGGKSNSTTYCIDDFAFGRKQVAMSIGEDPGTGGEEPGGNEPNPAGDDKADFASFNGGEPKTSYATYTNATGWTAENCAILAGDAEKNSNPYFTFITPGMIAPTLNGKVGAAGKLSSPTISGGIGTLTFNYGFPFSDNQFKLTIQVIQNGEVVKEEVLEKTGLEKAVAYGYSVDLNVAGDFQLVIENNCLSGSDKNKDRVAIWNLDWTEKN